jgi:hypothetical protein
MELGLEGRGCHLGFLLGNRWTSSWSDILAVNVGITLGNNC